MEETFQQIKNLDETTPVTALTTPAEVWKCIKRLKSGKPPGEDNIIPILLKHVPRKMIVQIYYIMNSCLKQQYFPKQWKNALVIPLKKPNKRADDPKSYRPISLLPVLGKVLERIIFKRIREHLDDNEVIIPEQFGFEPGKNTTFQSPE